MSEASKQTHVTDAIPMLRRATRNTPKFSRKALREGWSMSELSHRDPCPDCRGWISLNYEHDEDCIRIAYHSVYERKAKQ